MVCLVFPQSEDKFPSFLQEFKASVEEDGTKFYMKHVNIIHRQVRDVIGDDDVIISVQIGDTLCEAADWIVDGFDRGSYFIAAKDGKVIWEMATNT